MKIKIVKRIGKTLDGVKIGEYIQGKEYEVQEDLAKIFIDSGIAESAEPVIEEDQAEENTKPSRKK